MKRDELFAALQEIPWVPCPESEGRPRYRAAEAFHCTFCAYTVCARCYDAIPSSLLSLATTTTSGGTGGEGGAATNSEKSLADRTPTQAFTPNSRGSDTPNSADDFMKPRCFLCRSGVLEKESVPVFEWTCEGPRPPRRLTRGQGASYDVDVVQRYYTMKEQREKRAQSQAPLTAQFLGTEPSPTEFGGNIGVPPEASRTGVLGRRPFCEEGCSFSCVVQNPRLEQSLVWCGVNRQLRESHPSITGEETITPLHTIRCPPTLPGLPPHKLRVHIPYGSYGIHKIHAVALYVTEDIYRKATARSGSPRPVVKSPGGRRMEQGHPQRDGQLMAVKELPRNTVRPLLVVDVLHRTATSDPVRNLLPTQWLPEHMRRPPSRICSPRRENSITETAGCVGSGGTEGNEGEGQNNGTETKGNAEPPVMGEGEPHLTWPEGIRCEELLLAVDYLLQGRSVAVYGIASKYFFLRHVAQSAELRNLGVAFVDGYRSSANRVTRQLREISKQLQEQRHIVEKEVLRNLVFRGGDCDPFLRISRSQAPSRDECGNPSDQCYLVVSSSTSSESSRSRSYRSPVRDVSVAMMGGSTEKRRENMGLKVGDPGCCDLTAAKTLKATTPQRKESMTVCSPAPISMKRERSVMLVQDGGHSDIKRTTQQTAQGSKRRCGEKVCDAAGTGGWRQTHPEAVETSRKVRLWLRRYYLSEVSDWNYSVPLYETPCGERRCRETETAVTSVPLSESENTCLQPRYTVSSPDIMRRLRVECGAPLRSCVQWKSLPSYTAQMLTGGLAAQSANPPVHYSDYVPRLILVVHGIDELDPPLLVELQNIARDHPNRVMLLCSFDDPNWAMSNSAAQLEPFRLAYVHLRSMLLPRVHEMACVKSLTLLTDLEAAAAGGKRFGHHGLRGSLGPGTSLPLQDTIRRILFSLPATFTDVLRCMIERQEASGENVFVPMSLHQQHFDDRGMMISVGRLRAIERELTSNRLAVFDAAENKLMIPQHKKLLRVLEEVAEQRQNTRSNGGAPVEA